MWLNTNDGIDFNLNYILSIEIQQIIFKLIIK